ncbi:MAG: DNA primase [Pelotomaculum sp. PtaB.Bin104]|nr:MAG: DNA primase [Pelotomaculum sp. PtaB.Bin104]
MSTVSIAQKQEMNHIWHDIIANLKGLSVEDVYNRYVGGAMRVRGNKGYVRCWHADGDTDRHPSGVLYLAENRCWCFRCGQGGSTIDLVMQTLNIDFKETVGMMSADFGISLPGNSREEREQAQQAARERTVRRELESRFKEKENNIYQKLATLHRAIDRKIAGIKTVEDLERVGGLYHVKPVLEQVLETLRTGTTAERLAVLKSESVRRWCKWQ